MAIEYFWSDKEKEMIALSTYKDIVGYVHNKPHLATQFLHELWRTNNGEKMYKAMRLFSGAYGEELISVAEPNLPATILLMTGTYRASIDEVETFLGDILGMQYRLDNNLKFDEPLEGHIKEGVLKIVDGILAPLEPQLKEIQDGLN